ncbi:MAG TPA: hypothetical protein VMI06_14285 [Terriglobia bacterium]|nr:hypothetical protein [Terriglobia bacterium]
MTRHSAILTNLLFSLSLATGLLCATSSASAQTSERATIPFAFTADHQQFPAGTYEVRRLPDGLMSLYNLETGKIQLLMVRLEAGRTVQTRGRLVFHHDETGNSLMQVWIAGTTVHTELMVQPKLKQAVAKNVLPESTVEVGMK